MENIAKMNKQKSLQNLKTLTMSIMIIILCAVMILRPKIPIDGVTEGLRCSVNILIPSLFPFMFISSFIVKSGVSKKFEIFLVIS